MTDIRKQKKEVYKRFNDNIGNSYNMLIDILKKKRNQDLQRSQE